MTRRLGSRLPAKPLMWLLALGYPLVQAATVVLMMRDDPFSIFNRDYLLATVVILPPVLGVVAVWLGTRRRGPSWDWTFVLVMWIAAVAFLHYTFIGIAADGV